MRPFEVRKADTANMRRANTLLVAIAFAMLPGAGMASLLLVARARENAAAVADTIGIRVEFHTIFSLIQDTETGQRGFLLTRDPAYLDPYYTARLEIERKLAALERRVADRPVQLQNVKALHDVARKRIEILDRTIALAGAGNFEPLVVSSRDATTLAVVLGELVSNAIKHAFEGRDGGTSIHILLPRLKIVRCENAPLFRRSKSG